MAKKKAELTTNGEQYPRKTAPTRDTVFLLLVFAVLKAALIVLAGRAEPVAGRPS